MTKPSRDKDPSWRLARACGIVTALGLAGILLLIVWEASVPIAVGLTVSATPSAVGFWLARAPARMTRMPLRTAIAQRPIFAGLLFGSMVGAAAFLATADPVKAYYGPWVDVGGAGLAVCAILLLLLHSHLPLVESRALAIVEALLAVLAALIAMLSAANGTKGNDGVGIGLIVFITVATVAMMGVEELLRRRNPGKPVVFRLDAEVVDALGGPEAAGGTARHALLSLHARAGAAGEEAPTEATPG